MTILIEPAVFKKEGTYTWSDRRDHYLFMDGEFPKRSQALGGLGYIAGQLPGVVTVDGTPASRTIELRFRDGRKEIFASTVSDPVNGTYLIDDLNPKLLIDLVAREKEDGVYNDIILSKIRPWTDYQMYIHGPDFPNVRIKPIFKRVFEITGGVMPYQLSSDITIPEGTEVTLDGRFLTVDVTAPMETDLYIKVQDMSGLSVEKGITVSDSNTIVSKFTGNWILENDPVTGEPRLRSNQIPHSGSTSSTWSADKNYTQMSFRMFSSSEAGYDIFYLYVNESERARVSGPSGSYNYSTPINAGDVIRVTYAKDGSAIGGTDEAWVYIDGV
ncbi:hypothetical protein [Xanthomonas phage BUDD]|nr:hypothetical protein [Xanthomonas phage BUDD]